MIPQPLHRQWRRLCLAAGGGLLLGFAVIAMLQSPWAAGSWLTAATAFGALELYLLRQVLPFNYRLSDKRIFTGFTAATGITLLRGACIATLGGFLLPPWPSVWKSANRFAWLPGVLYLVNTALDFWDGRWARSKGQATRLGELLDTRFDALGLLAAALLAVVYGRLPPFYLAVGAAYYLQKTAVHIRRALGKACYEQKARPLARFLAGVQMGFTGIALLPLLPTELLQIAAVVISVPFLAGFVVDWRQITGKGAHAV
jgi:CDP-diacylglycerol--glycerol-3-phosphate 3-phosphatidyltransferase